MIIRDESLINLRTSDILEGSWELGRVSLFDVPQELYSCGHSQRFVVSVATPIVCLFVTMVYVSLVTLW